MSALPTKTILSGADAREIVEYMAGLKTYLTTAWCGLEEVAAEANASIRFWKEARGEKVPDEEVVYDEIEDERRKAAEAIRFALASVEHVEKLLNHRAYGLGKYEVKETVEAGENGAASGVQRRAQ